MTTKSLLSLGLAFFASATTALAQVPANDDCSGAIAAAVGITPFDSSMATDGSGLALDPLVCDMGPFGDEQVHQDVWFAFTATASDDYDFQHVDTGSGVFDSRIAIYNQGTCPDDPANVIACNDDDVGVVAGVLDVPLIGGLTYLVRLGAYAGTTPGGPGGLSVFTDPPPPMNPANGNYYLAIGAGGITWDAAKTAAEGMTFLGVQGHLATVTDQAENDFIYGALGGVNNYWVGGFQDFMDPNFSEPGGGWSWITGEPFTFTNWLVGEPNNTGSTPSEDFLELLDSGGFGQTWNDAAQTEHPAGYVVEFDIGTAGPTDLCNGDGGNGFGCTNCPCGNNSLMGTIGGCINAAGLSTRISASGDTSASTLPGVTTDLRFTLESAPAGAFCIMLSGSDVAPTNMMNVCFGLDSGAQSLDRDGLRCAVMNLKRHGGRSANGMGEIMDSTGPSRVWGGEAQPNGGIWKQGGFVAGQTRYFQVTFRADPMLVCMRGLNTSQALVVTFTP